MVEWTEVTHIRSITVNYPVIQWSIINCLSDWCTEWWSTLCEVLCQTGVLYGGLHCVKCSVRLVY